MIERLEVIAGAGTVIRYGHVAVWAGPDASPALLSFLAESARNLAYSPAGGQQLTDHLAGVLSSRDPEPAVPFAVVGPTPDGWVAVLHGRVQIWDGARWVVPAAPSGWMKSALWPQPTVSVTAAGGTIPAVQPESVGNLEAGVVPGGGMILTPSVRHFESQRGDAPVLAAGPSAARDEAPTTVIPATTPAGHDEAPTTVIPTTTPAGRDEAPTTVIPAAGGEPAAQPAATPGATGSGATGGAGSSGAPVAAPGDARETPGMSASTGTRSASAEPARTYRVPGSRIDLRRPELPLGRVSYPPLPRGGGPAAAVPGAPVVAGVLCRKGHLNRPGMTACARCSAAIESDGSFTVTGTRPALGCLIVDDGAVYRLDSAYLIGADPSADPTVRGGLARPLILPGEDVAADHAEIRLHDWDVMVTDRSSAGGTHVYEPDSTAWQRLHPFEPKVLQPGTHVALGQRVVTFVTPWVRPAGA